MEKIVDFVKLVKLKFLNLRIVVFVFIYREDLDLSVKLYDVNESLKFLLESNNFMFIDNLIIDNFCFNSSKFYLNFKGSLLFVVKFINFVRLGFSCGLFS